MKIGSEALVKKVYFMEWSKRFPLKMSIIIEIVIFVLLFEMNKCFLTLVLARLALRMAVAFALAVPFCNLAASPIALTAFPDVGFFVAGLVFLLKGAVLPFAVFLSNGFFTTAGFLAVAVFLASFFSGFFSPAAFAGFFAAAGLASAGRFSPAFFVAAGLLAAGLAAAGFSAPEAAAAGFFFVSSFLVEDPLAKNQKQINEVKNMKKDIVTRNVGTIKGNFIKKYVVQSLKS